MVEEEIMQLIRTDQILCFLCDRAVVRRQQLRADGCVEDIAQRGAQRIVAGALRLIRNQMDI